MILLDYYKHDLYNLKGSVGCFFVGDEVKHKGGDHYLAATFAKSQENEATTFQR